MRTNAMIHASDSQNPEYRPPLSLTPLAIEDLTGESVFSLTPTGRAEIADHENVALTGLLKRRLDEFRAARIAREQAKGKTVIDAMKREENAALLLAWTLDQEAGQ